MGFWGGQNRGRGGAILTPNELVLTFRGYYFYANFGENWSRNATMRVPTDGQTHRQTHRHTDANRFYNLSHAICYSYGTDNDSLKNAYLPRRPHEPISTKFGTAGHLADVITHDNFFGNHLRCFDSVRGRILVFFLSPGGRRTVLALPFSLWCEQSSQILSIHLLSVLIYFLASVLVSEVTYYVSSGMLNIIK